MVPSLNDHHILQIRLQGVPYVLCTDDKGVFETTLAHEYLVAARALVLSRANLDTHARSGLAHAFLPAAERQHVYERFFAPCA